MCSGSSVEVVGVGRAVACRVEWLEPLVELETDYGECEQGEFLRDAGEGDLAGLGELPSDHGDGRRPVACEAAVVVMLVPGRQVAADRGVGVALTWFTVGERGEAFVQVGDRRDAERRAVRRGEYIRERGRERWRKCPQNLSPTSGDLARPMTNPSNRLDTS